MVSLTCYNLNLVYIITKQKLFNNLNPQEMDDGKEDVNILDLTASEVNYNFIGLFDENQLQKEINRKLGE